MGSTSGMGMMGRIRTVGLATAGTLLVLGGAATSVVTASAATHFFNSTTTQTTTPISGFVGVTLSDIAKVAGHNPTGNPTPPPGSKDKPSGVSFTLFGPNATGCTGNEFFSTGLQPLSVHRVAKSGSSPATTVAGTYFWLAKYSGDSDNRPSSACSPVTISTQGGGSGGIGSGKLGISTGPGVPDTGFANSPVLGATNSAYTGSPASGSGASGGLIAGVLMLLAGPPLLLLARRSMRQVSD